MRRLKKILAVVSTVVLVLSPFASVNATVAFTAGATLGTGSFPGAAAAGDLDGDLDNDFVVVSADNLAFVYLNDGAGNFAFDASYAAGDGEDIELFDLNGDTFLDIISVDFNPGSLRILLGNGDGTFQAQTTRSATTVTDHMSLGDFNEDGDMDVVTANPNFATVWNFFAGNGDGTFDPPVSTSVGAGANSEGIVGAFIDGDAHLDVVVSNYSTGAMLTYLGNGDGTFDAPITTATVTNFPTDLQVADMDEDGNNDLIISRDSGPVITILLGNGDGTFGAEAAFGTGGAAGYDGKVADLDGDGHMDVAALNLDDSQAEFMAGAGDGTLGAPSVVPVGGSPLAFGMADFDGDGDLDFVIANSNDNNATIAINNSFLPAGGGGGGGGVPFFPPTQVTVLSPNGGESFAGGADSQVRWDATGLVDFVNVLFSPDDGMTWQLVAFGYPNTGVFRWTVPDVSTDLARIRVEGTDLHVSFVSDDSDAPFSIAGTAPLPPHPSGCLSLPEGTMSTSPWDGHQEPVSKVCPGDLLTTPSYPTVYVVTDALARRPFFDTQTFLTHYGNFASVISVTDATLALLPLSDLVLPKPGVALVKEQSDARTYAVIPNPADPGYPIIRALDSEAVAAAIFGPDWPAYVIDVEPTVFYLFRPGAPVVTAEPFDTTGLKRRDDLVAPSMFHFASFLGRIRAQLLDGIR